MLPGFGEQERVAGAPGTNEPKATGESAPSKKTPTSEGVPTTKSGEVDEVEAERRRVQEERRREVASLEVRFFERWQQVQALFPLLKKADLTPASGEMRVPLSAGISAEYGRRERELVHEDALVTWADGGLVRILFSERRAVQGGGMLRRRRWYLRTAGAAGAARPSALSMHLIVDEVFPSGARTLVHFPFHTGSFLRGETAEEDFPAAEKHEDLRTVPVESQERRVSFLREAIRLLELLDRRVTWILRAQQIRDQQELDRVFRGR